MSIIRPNESIGELQRVAARYAVEFEGIKVVPSVKEWCDEHGVPETNHWRTGKTVRNNTTGAALILLPEQITPSMQQSVLGALEFHGYEVAQLREPRAFLLHLFLHELAHAQFPDASEQECDDWAFGQFAKNAG